MSDRLPDDPSLVTTDLLRYVNQDPDFWSAVAKLNMRLSANMNDIDDPISPDDLEVEEIELEKFYNSYFSAENIGRKALVSASLKSLGSDTAEDSLVAISAEFIGCIPVTRHRDILVDRESATFVEELGTRVVALAFKNGENIYTLPLDKPQDYHAVVYQEKDLNEEPDLAARIRNIGRVIRYIVHTDRFFGCDFQTQSLQIFNTLEYMKTQILEINELKDCESLVVTKNDKGEDVLLEADSVLLVFPDMHDRNTPFQKSEDYEFGEPCLLVSKSDIDVPTIVPLSNLVDITKNKEPDNVESPVDALHDVFGTEAFTHLITYYEDKLNAAKDGKEFIEVLTEAGIALSSAIPAHLLELDFSAEGKLYREAEVYDAPWPRTYLSSETICEGADFQDFGVNMIDGRWRITLALQVAVGSEEEDSEDEVEFEETDSTAPEQDTTENDEELETSTNRQGDTLEIDEDDQEFETIFVVPNHDYLSRLWLSESSDIEIKPDDILKEFTVCEIQIKELFASSKFMRSDRNTQNAMIKDILDSTNEILGAYLTQGSGVDYEINCKTSCYRRVKYGTTKIRSEYIAKKPLMIRPDTQLHARKAYVSIPETKDDDTEPFASIDDLLLSGGRPMLVVDDAKKDIRYYVHLSDISALAPLIAVE